ncbi:MAG: hypothetical protein MI725_02650, partial [Pirellulales bacterium]|nr:hypothetical protein [Pirellulales bacterium]
QGAREKGYFVHIIYIWLSSVELAQSRVAVRVLQGGHSVPPETVARRYWRGIRNFFNIYCPLADTWTLCDNSVDELVIVATGTRVTEPTIYLPEVYETISRQATHGTA